MNTICKVCHGKGIIIEQTKEWDSLAINPLIVVCTLGFSLVNGKNLKKQKKVCIVCGGAGIVKIKEI